MHREEAGDLLAFMVVAQEGSFTRAAAKLGTSQSALSHTVRRLETRLGLRLLARTTRSVALTEAGARLLDRLAPALGEVEAALDDVNLQRFLSLVEEFRYEAQLLIVTHQKRTMESADALYGVTMAPGGSSKVVSQRVKKTAVEVAAPEASA